jgi:uncharacterized protein YcbK (DUF882 family)
MMLTKNFTREEMQCKCGCGGCNMVDAFLQKLQLVRDEFGTMSVNSGFRCQKHNTAVGGVKGSYHLLGLACDVRVFSEADRWRLARAGMKQGLRSSYTTRFCISTGGRHPRGFLSAKKAKG